MKRLLLATALLLLGASAPSAQLSMMGIGAADIGGVSAPSGLMLEDGTSFLLLEDGSSHLCLEGGC